MRTPQLVVMSLLVVVTTLGCSKEEKNTSTPAPATQPLSTGATAPTPPSTTMGEKVDDATITAKVKASLLADSIVKGTDVNVDTMGGVVTLKGAVSSQNQIDQALKIAMTTEGVASVQNHLTIK